jgi:hypothetical protein
MPGLFVKRPHRHCSLSNLLSDGVSTLEIKLPKLEADQLRLCSTKNENKCSCNSTPVYLFIVPLLSTEQFFLPVLCFEHM